VTMRLGEALLCVFLFTLYEVSGKPYPRSNTIQDHVESAIERGH
jgi:hypothetical protein